MPPVVPDFLRPLVAAAADTPLHHDARLAPPRDGSGRASAVLVALTESVPDTAGPGVLLIQRAAQLRRHPGQVAFPGGAVDPEDADIVAAALREAREEVGLDPASVTPVLSLPELYIARSGFVVSPVVAWWHHPHPVAPVDPGEVSRAGLLPVAALTDPANRFTVSHPSGLLGPGFAVQGFFVWGFTAILLDQLLTLAGWNRPWDEAARRPIPASVASAALRAVPGPSPGPAPRRDR